MQDTEALNKAKKEAIKVVKEIYKDEDITNIEVEEVQFEERVPGAREGGDWLITVGFTRENARTVLGGLPIPQRNLKVVKLDRDNYEFRGMTMRNPSS